MITPAKQSRPGPRAAADDSPLDLSMLPERRDWRRVRAFIESFLTHNDGSPFKLKPFQVDFLKGLFPATVAKRPRMSLLQLARGQGKSHLAGAIGVYCLYADGQNEPQVLLCASSLEQAQKQVFKFACRFISRSPELAKRARMSRDTVSTPFNGGEMYAVASTFDSLQGYGPTAAILDELHTVSADVWDALVTSTLKRDDSLLLAISTPSRNPESVMNTLVKDAREHVDTAFYFKDFPSDSSHPADCSHCIKASRPLSGASGVQVKALRSMLRKTPESTFRRLMLAQEGTTESDAWFTSLDIEAVKSSRRIGAGERVVLAFDGSFNNDSSVVCAITVEAKPHIEIVKIWEPVEGSRVPIGDVEATILKAAETFKVEEITADPFRWSRSLEALESKLTVSHFPQTQARMGPAITSLHTAIMDGTCTIADDPVLVQHFLNCRVRDTDRGIALSKPGANGGKDSAEKIDAAVTSVMGFSRATHYASKQKSPSRTATWRY